MKPYFITLLAGALCVPATYATTRAGNFKLTLLIIVGVALVFAMASMYYMCKTGRSAAWWTFPLAFVLGAFAAEGIALLGYNSYFGWSEARFRAGFRIARIEAMAISVVGAIAVVVAQLIVHWLNGKSKSARPRHACQWQGGDGQHAHGRPSRR